MFPSDFCFEEIQPDSSGLNSRQHSRISLFGFFRGTDCDTDHCLAVTKMMDRLSVNN
jgi:hypothetical protein